MVRENKIKPGKCLRNVQRWERAVIKLVRVPAEVIIDLKRGREILAVRVPHRAVGPQGQLVIFLCVIHCRKQQAHPECLTT